MYGGPLSRSNYQTYSKSARRDQSPVKDFQRAKTQMEDTTSKLSKSPKAGEMSEISDNQYKIKHRIDFSYNQNFARRQLVTGMESAPSEIP